MQQNKVTYDNVLLYKPFHAEETHVVSKHFRC